MWPSIRLNYAGSDEPARRRPDPARPQPPLQRTVPTGRAWLASLPRLIQRCLDSGSSSLTSLRAHALERPRRHRGPGAPPPRRRSLDGTAGRGRRGPETRLSARRSARGTPRARPVGRQRGRPAPGRRRRCRRTAARAPRRPAFAAGRADGVARSRSGAAWFAGSAWRRTWHRAGGRSGGSSTTWRPGPSSGAIELPESWEQLGRPFPRWLLEAALEVCQTRGAVGRRVREGRAGPHGPALPEYPGPARGHPDSPGRIRPVRRTSPRSTPSP